jgi:hypothetical protein
VKWRQTSRSKLLVDPFRDRGAAVLLEAGGIEHPITESGIVEFALDDHGEGLGRAPVHRPEPCPMGRHLEGCHHMLFVSPTVEVGAFDYGPVALRPLAARPPRLRRRLASSRLRPSPYLSGHPSSTQAFTRRSRSMRCGGRSIRRSYSPPKRLVGNHDRWVTD